MFGRNTRWHTDTCQVCDMFAAVSHDTGPITPEPHERIPADVVYRAEPGPGCRCTFFSQCTACAAGGG
ncbi:hypothetical protein ACGFZA_15815 [Streptomyces sp. NPDC048211]|uniref:hypothetical protein n=1 Tax=Streptomyces sp. NPDC048211 TaxID=3365516 RepID=UPI00371DEABF